MKRKLALSIVFVLALAMTLTLAACAQTAATKTATRWEKEEHTFNISMAQSDPDKTYVTPKAKEVDGKVYYRDFDIQTARAIESFVTALDSSKDEILPKNVKGTYRMQILPYGDNISYCEFITEQTIYAQYDKKIIEESSNWQDLKQCVAQASENPFSDNSGVVTLKSVTKTYVKFENNSYQQPLESSYEVDGFYIGKVEQTVSKQKISVVYESDKRNAKVSVNGAEAVDRKLNISSAQHFIDSNQILLYLRSLDKSSSAFQDSPSVIVYNPLMDSATVATFAKREANAIINRKASGSDDDNIYVNLNVVSVSVGSNALMVEEDLPVLKDKIDKTQTSDPDALHTTIRFRSGYLVYEIADYLSDDIVAALSDYTKEKNK